MALPTFLIIGATKAGTTSLHHYLGQHPDVFVAPRKETNFFAQESALCFTGDAVTVPEEYEEQFSSAVSQKAVGESSPAYLAVPKAPRRIASLLPNIKLIMILRDPADRAYSHYTMRRAQGREDRETFEEVLLEPDRDPEHSYTERGFYGLFLERYLKHFPREQLKIFLYEDLTKDTMNVVKECFEFIRVNPNFTPDISKRHNATAKPAPLKKETRQKLINLYRKDIEKLQTILGKDLSSWVQ
jgi:hypothetical protein